MAWDKWTQMDNNHRITERRGLEQTWKIIRFQQVTKQVLVLQQHPGWSCKQLQKQWGDKGGIPFLYIPSLLQTFDALMFHAKHHCWQGERASWLEQRRHWTQGGAVTAIPPDVLQKNLLLPKSKLNIDLYPEAWRHIPSNILTFTFYPKGLGFVLGGFLP